MRSSIRRVAASAGDFVARVEAALRDQSDSRALRRRVLDVIRGSVPYDAFVWPLTDPETGVGISPLAEVPCLPELPRLVRLRYRAPNRWTSLTGVSTLASGEPSAWRDSLATYGAHDVATVPFTDQFGCWGFLDLWRDHDFTPQEVSRLDSIAAVVTTALRRCQAVKVTAVADPSAAGAAVLLLSPDLEVRRATEASEALLRRLLPTDAARAPVPAGAYNVAAQLLARESGVDDHPAEARTFLDGGQLLGFRAARLGERGADIAVTIGPVSPRERMALFVRACGLTAREREVLDCLADGDDTRTVARRLAMSEYTVQDHLKAIASKTGLRSRRALLARATG